MPSVVQLVGRYNATLLGVTRVAAGAEHLAILRPTGFEVRQLATAKPTLAPGAAAAVMDIPAALQLGNASDSNETLAIVDIRAGAMYTVALLLTGRLVAWGEATVVAAVPAELRPDASGMAVGPSKRAVPAVASIAAGDTHVVALLSDGSVRAFGASNARGQLSVPLAVLASPGHQQPPAARGLPPGSGNSGQQRIVAIAAGADHSVLLLEDSSVVAFGDNTRNQTQVLPGLWDVVAVAAGGWHTLSLTCRGHVYGWGDGAAGQLRMPTAVMGRTIAIAAGRDFSMALLDDKQTVYLWGGRFGTCVHALLAWSVVAASTPSNHAGATLKLAGWFTGAATGTNAVCQALPMLPWVEHATFACIRNRAGAIACEQLVSTWLCRT
jgi:alpha-tubulin suppressor-like RCC1 family protein